jgi:glycosyltransferase involved in cell wall biosynthesis
MAQELPLAFGRKDAMGRLNILVLTSTFPRWEGDAIPPFVYELSRRLADKHNVLVLAPYIRGAKKQERIANIEVFRFKYWFEKGRLLADGHAMHSNLLNNRWLWLQVPFFLYFQILMIRRIVKSHKIDVIHAHWIIPQCLSAVISTLFLKRKPEIVATIHGGDIFGLRWANGLKRLLWNRLSGLTVVSTTISDEVEEIGIKEDVSLEVIPMGVDTKLFSPDKHSLELRTLYASDGPLILYVGRFSEKKGVHYLIKAMPEVLAKHSFATLLLVGYGEQEEDLRYLCDSLGLPDNRIVFAGAISNEKLPPYYATADIFVGPSIRMPDGNREGAGTTFAEAMSCGINVITTDLPNFRDFIFDGENGFIVKQKNPEAIAKKILDILGHPDRRVGRNAREYIVEHYDWELIAGRYNDFFRRVSQEKEKL